MARRSCEASVARQKRRIQRLGKRDVDGIVGREIVPQVPYPRQKDAVGISPKGKVEEVVQRRAAPLRIDFAGGGVPSNDLGDLDIDEVGRMQRVPRAEEPPLRRLRRRRAQENLEQSRSVDDDQRRSRSARIAWAGDTDGVVADRAASRSCSSLIVGRSATSLISLSR